MTQKTQPSIWVKKITQDFLECSSTGSSNDKVIA